MRAISIFMFVGLLLAVSGTLRADVPPDRGYTRVTADLVVETKEDLSEYRFFIKSGADVEEVILKKDEKAVIKPLGGGAWYRSGALLAVPVSLAGLKDIPAGGDLGPIKQTIYDGQVPGMIKLLDHSFIRDVKTADAAGQKDAIFRIERDPESKLKAVPVVSGIAPVRKTGEPSVAGYSLEPKSPSFWAAVGGGSLLSLAFISFGVWFVRRSKATVMEARSR